MNKNKLSIFLLSLVLALMFISCSNNTPGVSATGLSVGRVGAVFADPNYKYDVAYKNGSVRYIADVTKVPPGKPTCLGRGMKGGCV